MSEESTFPSEGVKSETEGTTTVSTEERKKEANFFDSIKSVSLHTNLQPEKRITARETILGFE